jgi:hypothetical protein
VRQTERTDISTGKECADNIAAGNWEIEVRRVGLVVVDRDARGAWAAHVIAR